MNSRDKKGLKPSEDTSSEQKASLEISIKNTSEARLGQPGGERAKGGKGKGLVLYQSEALYKVRFVMEKIP
jgi:hypothetical protein